jgi:Tetratricopeptide repeat
VAALATTAGATLVALMPLAREREELAQRAEASSLSVDYLRIALNEHPEDPEVRFSLAAAEQHAGRFEDARKLLTPLASRSDDHGKRSLLRLLTLEQAALAALPEHALVAREPQRARCLSALDALATRADVSDEELHGLASTAASLADPERRAALLTRLIARTPAAFAAHAEETELALLAAGSGREAARLAERRALLSKDPALALHALALAEASDDAELARTMVERFERLHPKHRAFAERALSLALARGDLRRALVRAERLMKAHPAETERLKLVRDVATWSGDQRRALAVQTHLARRGIPGELSRALGMAEQRSDLPLMRELLELEARRGGDSAGRVLARARVLEALGAPREALDLLENAAHGAFQRERKIWDRAAQVARALGDSAREDALLHGIDERFGFELPNARRRAQIALRAGRHREAASELVRVDDGEALRHAAELAWNDDDVGLARILYRQRTQRTDAIPDDFYRLSVLEGLAGDERTALRVAMAGYTRFGTKDMYSFALSSALGAQDKRLIDDLLARSSDPRHPFHREPELYALRVSARQEAARAAIAGGELTRAKTLLADAARDLDEAQRGAKLASARQEALQKSQLAQEWNLALGQKDDARLRTLYPHLRPRLTPREDVWVLARMGERDKALDTSLAALREDRVAESDRPALVREAEALKAHRVRELRVGADFTRVGPLDVPRGYLSVGYDFGKLGVIAGASYAYLDVAGGAGFATGRPNEVAPFAGVHVARERGEARAVLGVDTRNGGVARPFLDTRLALELGDAKSNGTPSPELALALRVNETANDTPALRVLGVRDELGATATLPIGKHLYGALSATGTLYSSRRDRTLLGGGFTGEAALGANVGDDSTPLRGNARLFARTAPRFRRNEDELPSDLRELSATPAGSAVPDSTTFIGVGASAARGEYALPPLDRKKFAFLLDGSAGLLVPQKKLGLSGRAGVGVSLLGEDMLSVSARASNVVGVATPGKTVWSVQAEYAVSLWK